MGTYNSSVDYYRINANNTNIAVTNTGVGSPTEPLSPPLAGGTYSAGVGTTTITGQAGSTFNIFSPGQYLYFINSQGNYALLGQISVVGSSTSITLTGNSLVQSPSIAAGNVIAASYSLITTTESIYIRVSTERPVTNNNANIPLMTAWRTGNTTSSPNATGITKLEQISSTGLPVSNAGAVTNIPFTLQVMNSFTVAPGNTCWNSFDELPSYIWIRADISLGGSSLAGQSMFRWITEETIPALLVTPQFSQATLINSGYLQVNIVSTGGVGTGGNA